MYKVIHEFLDLEDKSYHYHVGDTYPRHGVAPTKERIIFLLSSQNLLHTPVIEEVTDFNAVERGMVEAENAAGLTEIALNEPEPAETKEYKPKRRTARKKANKADIGKGE